MLKTPQQLNGEIDATFTSNGIGAITGLGANAVLKSLAGSGGNYFSIPKDSSVTLSDVGKLMMIAPDGTAKVYQYAPEAPEKKGRWIVKINELTDTDADTQFEIESLTVEVTFNQVDWRAPHAPSLPADEMEEMEWIQEYINNHLDLDNLNTFIVDDELIIEEDEYDGTEIFVDGAKEYILIVDTISAPLLPPAPTAFPLGKLIGIDESENALIGTGMIETYLLDGTININYELFDNAVDIDFTNEEQLIDLLQHFILPAPNGKVKALNPDDFEFDHTTPSVFRHHFLGVPICATANTVTVMSMQQFSYILNFCLRLRNKGILGS